MSITSYPSSIVFGSKVPASIATPEALSAVPLVCSSVVITAGRGRAVNTGAVYLGSSDANDTQFFPLAVGATITLFAGADENLDLSTIFVDAVSSGDGVQFIATTPPNQ
jgi:hypothetical protein